MEHDLTKICNAIPVSSTGNVSTQAASILKGMTGVEEDFDIVSGTKPTLFAAPISQSLNTVTISSTDTASLNGGFAQGILVSAKVNGVEILDNPFSVTSQMDHQTLTVTLSKDGFSDGVSTLELIYHDISGHGVIALTINDVAAMSDRNFVISLFTNDQSSNWPSSRLIAGNEVIETSSNSAKEYVLVAIDSSVHINTIIPDVGVILSESSTEYFQFGASSKNDGNLVRKCCLMAGFVSGYNLRTSYLPRLNQHQWVTNGTNSFTSSSYFKYNITCVTEIWNNSLSIDYTKTDTGTYQNARSFPSDWSMYGCTPTPPADPIYIPADEVINFNYTVTVSLIQA